MRMRKLTAPALLAVAVMAAGCGKDRAAGTVVGHGSGADVVPTARPHNTDPGKGSIDTAGTALAYQGMNGVRMAMESMGTSGVTGEAALTPLDSGRTSIMVQIAGARRGIHAGHVHTGSCASLGRPVAPLGDITVPADSASPNATATTTVKLPLATLADGGYAIAYHRGTGETTGPAVVCGAIPKVEHR
jgi:hypothetical protein